MLQAKYQGDMLHVEKKDHEDLRQKESINKK